MNTKEVANKWTQMCREGKNLECIQALYGDNVTSKEMSGVPYSEVVTGKQNVWEKSKQWLDNVVEFHGSEISEPVVAENHFTSKMSFDVTFKDRGRQQMEEVCVFEVNDGKIVNEQFFIRCDLILQVLYILNNSNKEAVFSLQSVNGLLSKYQITIE